ncbi:DeoR/GlpR family DNA-binding transcription regulator [Bacillus sp. J14TS2]|uniref:DeoR/GlpR family DNA-binding transcription regulator n=1 Tax=Bacillus sp. J14TS2 TaxID=2807188 RepID=UPI001FD17555|nr:DeoR/GlpR family DNA-binding transcription regulator [Bacillus sp. J14TS2]
MERRNKIKEIVRSKKSVKVSELVHLFKVSEETIRRDLNQIEKDGLIQKNYGGAILLEDIDQPMDFILPVQQRKRQFLTEKNEIGRRAAELVQEGQIVILDAGTTTWCTVKNLHQLKDLTIISNALNVVEECSKNGDSSIYLLGGKLRRHSMSLVGPQIESELEKYSANYVFLGTSGFSLRQGFMSSDLYEAEIKRAMVSAGEKIVLLADHSKFQKVGLTSFCHLKDIDILITSDLVDEQILKEIRDAGVEVIAVPLP